MYLVHNLLIINILCSYVYCKIRTFITEFQAVMQVTNNPADIVTDKEMEYLRDTNERQ